jgi:hypothetical protein
MLDLFVMGHRRTHTPLPESEYFFLLVSRPKIAKSLKERTKNTLAQCYCQQNNSNLGQLIFTVIVWI